jgi:hypothetical protein
MQADYRFRLTEEHLLTSVLRYRQQIWWWRQLLRLKWPLGIVLGVLAAFFVCKGIRIAAVSLGGLFGAIAGALLLGWRIDAWLIRRQLRRLPYYNDEILFCLSESGAHGLGLNSEVRLGWAAFTKACRFEDGVLLFQGPGLWNWLPDSAAASAAAVATAQELARAHIRDYRNV